MSQSHLNSANEYYIDIHMQSWAIWICRWLLSVWWMHVSKVLLCGFVLMFK